MPFSWETGAVDWGWQATAASKGKRPRELGFTLVYYVLP